MNYIFVTFSIDLIRSGAGIFVTTVVVGVISFISKDLALTNRPFIRDVLFYLGAVSLAFITLHWKEITTPLAIRKISLT